MRVLIVLILGSILCTQVSAQCQKTIDFTCETIIGSNDDPVLCAVQNCYPDNEGVPECQSGAAEFTLHPSRGIQALTGPGYMETGNTSHSPNEVKCIAARGCDTSKPCIPNTTEFGGCQSHDDPDDPAWSAWTAGYTYTATGSSCP